MYKTKTLSSIPSRRMAHPAGADDVFTCWDMYQSFLRFPTNFSSTLSALDDKARGGFKQGEIVEIAGKAGAGKTRLALQIMARHLTSNAGSRAIYFSTGKPLIHFLLESLEQEINDLLAVKFGVCVEVTAEHIDSIAEWFNMQDLPVALTSAAVVSTADVVYHIAMKLMDRVTCVPVFDAYSLLSALDQLLYADPLTAGISDINIEQNADNTSISIDKSTDAFSTATLSTSYALDMAVPHMFMIDSVAAILSPLLGHLKNLAGHSIMFDIGKHLQRLCEEYHGFAVVTNTVLTERSGTMQDIPKPSLGRKWATIPNIRLMLASSAIYIMKMRDHTPEPPIKITLP